MYQFGCEIAYSVEYLSPDNAKLLGDFSCGNKSIDDYLQKTALIDTHNVCYLCRDTKTNKLLGFASLACSGIYYKVQDVIETIPAIKISYFAVEQEIQKLLYDADDLHYYFSDMFFFDIVNKCREISDQHLGAAYIILYAVPDAKHFYERNLFQNYTEYMQKDHTRYLHGCIPMYMEL